jgi:hypothetical protein
VRAQDAVVVRAIVEVSVRSAEHLVQGGARPLNLLDAMVELAQLLRRHRSPLRSGPAGRADQRRDLRQGEASKLEQVDERDLLDSALVVDPLATHAPGCAQQSFALVEAQGRRRETGACPQLRDRQSAH